MFCSFASSLGSTTEAGDWFLTYHRRGYVEALRHKSDLTGFVVTLNVSACECSLTTKTSKTFWRGKSIPYCKCTIQSTNRICKLYLVTLAKLTHYTQPLLFHAFHGSYTADSRCGFLIPYRYDSARVESLYQLLGHVSGQTVERTSGKGSSMSDESRKP